MFADFVSAQIALHYVVDSRNGISSLACLRMTYSSCGHVQSTIAPQSQYNLAASVGGQIDWLKWRLKALFSASAGYYRRPQVCRFRTDDQTAFFAVNELTRSHICDNYIVSKFLSTSLLSRDWLTILMSLSSVRLDCRSIHIATSTRVTLKPFSRVLANRRV